MKGIHVRYLGDALRAVDGIGVFAKGTVAFAPREIAVRLLASGEFEAVTKGPTAQVFVVRIGQDTLSADDGAAPRRDAPDELADFELELEEEERRLAAAAPPDPVK